MTNYYFDPIRARHPPGMLLPRHVRSNGAYDCRGQRFCAAETGACAGNDWTAVGIPEACWNAIGQSGMGDNLGGDPRCMNEPEPPSMSTVSVDCQAVLRVAWQGCAGGRPDMCAAQAACDSNNPAAVGVPPACYQAVGLVLAADGVDGCRNSMVTNVTVACQAAVHGRLAAECTTTTDDPETTAAAATTRESAGTCPRNCGTESNGGGSCRSNGRCLSCNANRVLQSGRCYASIACKGRRIQTGSQTGSNCRCLDDSCHYCNRRADGDTCTCSTSDATVVPVYGGSFCASYLL